MVIGNQDTGGASNGSHPSGIPQDQIDNIMSGIANTGDVKMNNHRKKLRQRFDIIKKLGQGTYGKVQLGINKETGQEVAIKTIKKCKIEAEADLVRIRREVQIMSSVQHPNIIHIYEVFENREKMVLVMEFAAGGELYDYLSERKVLSEEEARRIFRQVATAVYYCHKHKICHRDLKLENILLDEHGNAKIADFGLSNVFNEQCLLATFCGSPLYASPEIVEGTPYHGPEVDCWSLGVLLYTLVYGSMPFDGSNFKRLVKQISQGDYYEPKKPSRASSLIREMLTVCPRKRATIEQICSHWWVNENDNLSCLELAEDLANQTPVRLDVLLSLTPVAVTADQLVVTSADCGNSVGKSAAIPRSHSVGSIRDVVPNTEAERRILDMVAAGGEAALMPSPTRTITPAQSPLQTKRKLENTISTDNAASVALKKKDKPEENISLLENETAQQTGIESTLLEESLPMETDELLIQEGGRSSVKPNESVNFSAKDMEVVGGLCEQLIQDESNTEKEDQIEKAMEATKTAVGKLEVEEAPEKTKGATKVIKKFVSKHKTADLVNVIGQIDPENIKCLKNETIPERNTSASTSGVQQFVRKCSLQDESPLNKFNTERRKSRILETAEKFQQMNTSYTNTVDKNKKLYIPGVSVGNFKKEYERKATTGVSNQEQQPTADERQLSEQASSTCEENLTNFDEENAESSSSKVTAFPFSLEEARRSMENSIALLRQAQTESSKDVNQLCAKTENIRVSDTHKVTTPTEREKKLMNARAIIGNAIQPVLRRPQPLPPLPSTSFFGNANGHGNANSNGSGGCAQMHVVSGSAVAANPRAIINSNEVAIGHRKQPFGSTQSANSNVALAAARQALIGRLAAGGIGSSSSSTHIGKEQFKSPHTMYKPSLVSSSSSSPLPSISCLSHYTQPQNPLPTQSFGSTATAANPKAHALDATTIINSYNAINTNSTPKPFYNTSQSPLWKISQAAGETPSTGTMKTSTASITLKSATLPRRKTAKTEIQLDIKPPIIEQPSMRFTTEMQHPVADLRSAPPREGPVPFSPVKSIINPRASSLEPKEHVIPIQKPPSNYARTFSNTSARSNSLSRQSTNDSESDTATANMSQATITGSSQPIKKSPREFIIPIAVEGGGFITPREGSIEPSESSHTTGTTSSRSTFTRLRPTRRIGSLLSESGVDDKTPFQKLRTSSTNRDGEDDTRFTLHKLRSSRPVKKISQDNDSQSSGEEDDDDGFEILTAENLFSTLLQRVRALTNRMNVNNDISTAFPSSSRLLTNMRQAQSPFWNQEPFGSRLNSATANAPWRHSMSRDLGSDMESMFSRTGATLPRGKYPPELIKDKVYKTLIDNTVDEGTEGPLDLADLDLSRLRLSKKDLETLSNIAPGLPKCFQDQLLAKLPPTQARKLSRTLSVQTNQNCSSFTINKRSQSSGRNTSTGIDIAYDRDEKETPSCSITTNSEKSSEFKKEIEATSERAQHMTCTKINDDENTKSSGIIQNTNVNEKYKYYSPYVIKTVRETSQRNNINEGLTDLVPIGCVTMLGRPPSGRLSPSSSTDSTLRRPTQRRISRLIRPDLLEIPQEETVEESSKFLNPDNETTVADSYRPVLKTSRHVRNKSLELFAECTTNNSKKDDSLKNSRRSLSRSRDVNDKVNADKHQLADKILQELQILSSMQSQREVCQELNDKPNILNEKPTLTTAKKLKKTKSKEKSTESSTDVDSKNTNNVIKKVKKIVKKSDPLLSLKVQENQRELCETNNSVSVSEATSPKKMSKLKRPKSYPMKESVSIIQVSEMCNTTLTSAKNISSPTDEESKEHRSNESNIGVTELNSNSSVVPRESRLLRPKSYPSSKLSVQTESKKNDRNISNTTLAVCESALISSTKKVSKGLKKSKLSQLSNTSASIPIPIPIPNSISTKGEDIKELSPISNNIKTKEKAVEKRTNKGLLYAIGQKFEKLRASATSSSCANIPIQKQSSADNAKSEKVINKTSEVKKTKSLGCNSYPAPKTSDKINNCKENKDNKNETNCIASKPLKSEKRSRIDAMIRNLRERSVPRTQPTIPSESNYIKRAVSVEEMPGTFNKKSVNKMLGLFKRADKGSTSENRVRTTRSTSNIERHVPDASPIYQNTDIILKLNNKIEKNNTEACVDELFSSNKPAKTCKNEGYCKSDTLLPTVPVEHPTIVNPNCPECCIELSEEKNDLSISNIKNYKEGIQEKRKGLMLELLRIEKGQNASSTYGNIYSGKKYPSYNDNEIYSNISQYSRSIPSSSGNGSNVLTMENSSNNNISSMINSNTNTNNNNSNNNHSSSLHTSQTSGYRTSSTHEMNQNNNLLSPSFENIGNYSSDSRSYQEDCASTSTFLSPTEEAELCFDTWSVCSEDNYRRQHATPSPTVSRLSRASQASSPTRRGGDSSETSESVVDRIKRRSFYCRFNEKRPKRTSSIVGPNAVREYYREKSSTTKTRSSTKIATTEREHSPDITQEFFRPLKLSPIGTELKPPIYRSSFSTTHTDYSSAAGRPRKSLSDIRAPPSPSCLSERRHGSCVNPDKDLLTNSPIFASRYKINAYEDVSRSKFAPSDTYYNTYNPKRRFSFTSNANASNTNGGISNTNSTHIDGYATMGRRPIRAYDHRTMSLLDPSNYSTPTYRHEASTATATPSTVRDFTTSLSRSNSRYRKSSTSRSPNNI